ncbi:peptidoglycan-binding domain-containing protein [uncultured Azohydromonas sp.]|jgi:Putative peptidoglycan binding domain.|uniref:peptidoglycan-binding domain-containing protein n=1 Tax=uncultured Azohydromonas sp. TaxID=487342 RepID=UPI00260BD659|nr:peptidoglycan-binding domain-containing protein [uncultured Azohydromonas sp.]
MSDTINPPAPAPAPAPSAPSGGALVPANAGALSPEDARANPFKAIALLLKSVRESLEGVKRPGQAPRWVRIARIRGFQGSTDYISKGVIPALDKGFIFAITYLADLTLKAQDMLYQADSAKALIEVSGEMLKTVTRDDFAQSLAAVVGQEGVTNPLGPAGGFIDTVLGFVDKIPEPEDLEAIGKELYGLLAIEQLALDDATFTNASKTHLSIAASGKVRLLQMALTARTTADPALVKSITVRSLGKDKAGTQNVSWLGGRRITDKIAPTQAVGTWGEGAEAETVYEFSFEGDEAGKDLEEANLLLEKMGYATPAVADKKAFSADFAKRLRRFQKLNGLPISGALDNHTLNRLWHLNFKDKTLTRAKPYDEAALAGFDDSKNAA